MENSLDSKQKKIQIPDPVYYGSIEFNDGDTHVQYTDCWEISVLRLLHFLFGEKGIIMQQRLRLFMDLNDAPCQALCNYFIENPTYQMKEEFYQDEEGLVLRAKWCQFLNKSGLFYLKKEGKYEVAATFPNTLAFFRGFFPKLQADYNSALPLTLESVRSKQYFSSYVKIFNQIYEQLSSIKLQAEIDVKILEGSQFLYFTANQKLHIEGEHKLDWIISEAYNVGEEIEDRQGGHSDYRYAQKQDE